MNEKVIVEKMNMVLEAAAMNIKLYSFEQLISGAPVLFINAFEPLFEHGISGLNPNPNNLEAHEKNCDLLLNELRRKVEPDRLQNTSGRKLSSGDAYTVSVVADIYYERSEFMRTRFDDYLSAPPKVIHPRHRMLKKDSSKKKALLPEDGATTAHGNGNSDDPQEVIQNLQQYVASLEQKLETIQSGTDKRGGGRKGKRRGSSREPSKSRKAADVDRSRRDADRDLDIIEDDSESVSRAPRDHRRNSSINKPLRSGSSKLRPKRPSSAPAKRIVVASGSDREDQGLAVRPSSSRGRANHGLVSASAHEKHEHPPTDSPGRKLRPWSGAPYRPQPPQYLNILPTEPESNNVGADAAVQSEKEPFDPSIHTFDMRSGRRILIVDDERLKAQSIRNEAMGIVMGMDDFRDHNKPKSIADRDKEDGDRPPPEPTKPEWPGARTERSVREYNVKTKVARVGPDKLPPGSLPQAQMLPSYSDLQASDMVLTVEHCCNCHFHNTTLRHDEDQYCTEADNMLKSLATSIHAFNPCLRLGVYRFNANVTPKSRDSDDNSRIGAFEVQIAYRNMFGDLQKEMLHSKLATRRWPSKSVTHKRLTSFLSKVKVKTHKEPGATNVYDVEGKSCPVGMGHWTELSMASESWRYIDYNAPDKPPPATRGGGKTKSKNQSGNTGTVEAVVAGSHASSIEWIFDARELGDQPQHEDGEVVWVFKFGGERHPLLGTVVEADGKNAALERVVTVQLNYVDTSIIVPETHCQHQDTFKHALPSYGFGDLPVQLRVLFVHGKNQIRWTIQENDSLIDNQHFLCRKSIFQQVKELALTVEKAKRGRGTYMVPNDKEFEPSVDLQLCYAEPILDWICDQSPNEHGQVDMDALVTRIVPAPPVKPKSPRISPRVSPRVEQEVTVVGSARVPHLKTSPRLDEATAAPASDALKVSFKDTPQEQDRAGDPVQTSAPTSARKASPRATSRPRSTEDNNEPRQQTIVAGSVRTFVTELLLWCEKDAPASDIQLSPRAQLKRNTVHLKKLFLVDASLSTSDAASADTKSLDLIQFSNALVNLGLVSCSTDVLMGLLATFDDDGDGLLQYDELVAFLNDESPDKYSMGDMWINIRSVLIKETADGVRVHRLGELDEEMRGACKEGEEALVENDFIKILHKFGLLEPTIISKANQKTLLERFATKNKGSFGVLFSSKQIDYAKFLAWLHPVDVARTSKRLARSVDMYVGRQSNGKTKKDVINQLVTSLMSSPSESPVQLTAEDLMKEVTVKALLEAMYVYQVPMSRAEGRAFSRYFKHAAGDVLRVCECAAILTGDLLVHAIPEASEELPSGPTAMKKQNFDSSAFDFSGEFDKSPRQGQGASNDSNIFAKSGSFDREAASKDEVGTPMTGKAGHGLDLCIDLLEISGDALLTAKFDKVGVVLSCGSSKVKSSFSSNRQKGTNTRLLDITDGQHILHLNVRSSSDPVLGVELCIADHEHVCGTVSYSLASDIELYKNRAHDESGSAKVQMTIPITNDTGASTDNISIQVNIHFIEAKSSVASRIRKMSSKDLGEFRFQPLSKEFEDDDDNDDGASRLPMGISFGLSSLETPTKTTSGNDD